MKSKNRIFNSINNYFKKDKILSQELFENHNFIMLIIDPKSGNIIKANKKAFSFYGYIKEEFYKMKIQDINVLDYKQVDEEMKKAKAEKRNFFYFNHRLANKEIRDVEVYSTPINYKGKEYLHSIIFDVTKNRLQKTYFNQIFLKTPIATVILDNENNVVDLNSSFTKLFHFSKNDILDKKIRDVLANDEALKEDVDDTLNRIKRGALVTKRSKRLDKYGKILHVQITFFPLINYGKQLGKVVTFLDITDKILKENELKLFEKVLANNTEGITITDNNGNIQWVNRAFTKISGYTLDEVKGNNPRILKSGKHSNSFYKNMWDSIINLGNWQGEIYNKNKEGIIYPELLSISSIKNEDNEITYYIATFSDITESKRKEKKIWDLVYKDTLTDIYNRTYFMDRLNEEISRGKTESIAVLFIDLDDFKRINDTLGHSIGDIVLKEISKKIVKSVRAEDIVARIGGDEFTILISDFENKEQINNVANRIRNSMDKAIIINNNNLYITASIGVSINEGNVESAEELMKAADIAMYKAKENKGSYENRVVYFNSEMNKDIDEEFVISNELINCLENEELYVNYQPIVDMETEEIVGTEALLRWKNSNLGLVPPDKFIPIAEKTGLINKIGQWVIKNACIDNKQWQLDGHKPIFVSVNVSVIQLKQERYSLLVKKILDETKLDPKYLELEITESISMENFKKIKNTLKELNAIGVNIVMDDFGTGYSSLAELSNMYVSKLKIDKSFIADISNKFNSQQITLAIVAVAKSLNIEVVAEGIETKEQLKYLRDINCDYGQGYLFSKPIEFESVKKLLL